MSTGPVTTAEWTTALDPGLVRRLLDRRPVAPALVPAGVSTGWPCPDGGSRWPPAWPVGPHRPRTRSPRFPAPSWPPPARPGRARAGRRPSSVRPPTGRGGTRAGPEDARPTGGTRTRGSGPHGARGPAQRRRRLRPTGSRPPAAVPPARTVERPAAAGPGRPSRSSAGPPCPTAPGAAAPHGAGPVPAVSPAPPARSARVRPVPRLRRGGAAARQRSAPRRPVVPPRHQSAAGWWRRPAPRRRADAPRRRPSGRGGCRPSRTRPPAGAPADAAPATSPAAPSSSDRPRAPRRRPDAAAPPTTSWSRCCSGSDASWPSRPSGGGCVPVSSNRGLGLMTLAKLPHLPEWTAGHRAVQPPTGVDQQERQLAADPGGGERRHAGAVHPWRARGARARAAVRHLRARVSTSRLLTGRVEKLATVRGTGHPPAAGLQAGLGRAGRVLRGRADGGHLDLHAVLAAGLAGPGPARVPVHRVALGPDARRCSSTSSRPTWPRPASSGGATRSAPSPRRSTAIPAVWRPIARANGIVDPRLPPAGYSRSRSSGRSDAVTGPSMPGGAAVRRRCGRESGGRPGARCRSRGRLAGAATGRPPRFALRVGGLLLPPEAAADVISVTAAPGRRPARDVHRSGCSTGTRTCAAHAWSDGPPFEPGRPGGGSTLGYVGRCAPC